MWYIFEVWVKLEPNSNLNLNVIIGTKTKREKKKNSSLNRMGWNTLAGPSRLYRAHLAHRAHASVSAACTFSLFSRWQRGAHLSVLSHPQPIARRSPTRARSSPLGPGLLWATDSFAARFSRTPVYKTRPPFSQSMRSEDRHRSAANTVRRERFGAAPWVFTAGRPDWARDLHRATLGVPAALQTTSGVLDVVDFAATSDTTSAVLACFRGRASPHLGQSQVSPHRVRLPFLHVIP
jgi:hypothetical protein